MEETYNKRREEGILRVGWLVKYWGHLSESSVKKGMGSRKRRLWLGKKERRIWVRMEFRAEGKEQVGFCDKGTKALLKKNETKRGQKREFKKKYVEKGGKDSKREDEAYT